MTSEQIIDLLVARRYEPPEWFTLREVPPNKGAARHLDLVAWNTFSSRGLRVDGIEVKVSRSDWLRELKNAEKAERTFAMVERFFVAAPESVVKLDELPPEWGLIEVRGERLFNVRVPAVRERGPYSKGEVVGIMRRVQATWYETEKVRALQHQLETANDRARASFDEERVRLQQKRQAADAELLRLRELIGVHEWSKDQIEKCGEFRALLARFGDGKDALAQARRGAERGIAELQSLIHAVERLQGRLADQVPA